MRKHYENGEGFGEGFGAELDPELVDLFELIRPVPEREPGAVHRSYERFLQELGTIHPAPARRPLAWLFGQARGNGRRLSFSAALAFLVVAALLFGSAGATAYAAQAALPGDTLYTLKTGLEQTRLQIANDAGDQAQLELSFAERRLQEIERLIASGRYDRIQIATQDFEIHVNRALQDMAVVASGDPARAGELTTQASQALARYSLALQSLMTQVPAPVVPEMERALQASRKAEEHDSEVEFAGVLEQILPGAVVIDGRTFLLAENYETEGTLAPGTQVKVEAYQTINGQLILIELETFTLPATAEPEKSAPGDSRPASPTENPFFAAPRTTPPGSPTDGSRQGQEDEADDDGPAGSESEQDQPSDSGDEEEDGRGGEGDRDEDEDDGEDEGEGEEEDDDSHSQDEGEGENTAHHNRPDDHGSNPEGESPDGS